MKGELFSSEDSLWSSFLDAPQAGFGWQSDDFEQSSLDAKLRSQDDLNLNYCYMDTSETDSNMFDSQVYLTEAHSRRHSMVDVQHQSPIKAAGSLKNGSISESPFEQPSWMVDTLSYSHGQSLDFSNLMIDPQGNNCSEELDQTLVNFAMMNPDILSTHHLNHSYHGSTLPAGTVRPRSLSVQTEKLHFCKFPGCSRVFDRRQNLKSHELSHVPHTEKQYKCRACHLVFARVHDLNRHFKSHINERKYVCTTCNKAFNRSDAMRRHQKSGACERMAKASDKYDFLE